MILLNRIFGFQDILLIFMSPKNKRILFDLSVDNFNSKMTQYLYTKSQIC